MFSQQKVLVEVSFPLQSLNFHRTCMKGRGEASIVMNKKGVKSIIQSNNIFRREHPSQKQAAANANVSC